MVLSTSLWILSWMAWSAAFGWGWAWQEKRGASEVIELSRLRARTAQKNAGWFMFLKPFLDAAEYQIGPRGYSWCLTYLWHYNKSQQEWVRLTRKSGAIQWRNNIGTYGRTHAVCMPLCTATCGVKQSLSTTRYPCDSLVALSRLSRIVYYVRIDVCVSYPTVFFEDWRVCGTRPGTNDAKIIWKIVWKITWNRKRKAELKSNWMVR